MLQSLSFLLVGVFASAAVQRYVFGHATAEFVDVAFFVVLGALFTATPQTIVPRRDLTTLSGHPGGVRADARAGGHPALDLQRGGKAGVGRRARGAGAVLHDDPLQRREFALLRYPIVPSVADVRLVVLLVIARDDTTPPADSWVQVEGVLSSRELPRRSG